ncbi:MAG: hypothetical protein M0C28_20645 [Candidatus Moduliflexus flocculans]|nr:hypothetical protein [Candidatus Moduliflexus flocculans]
MPKRIVSQGLVIGVLLLGASLRTAACKTETPTPAGSSVSGPATAAPPADGGSYEGLLALWKEFREFQKPRVTGGVPDYSAAAMAEQRRGLQGLPGPPGRHRSGPLARRAGASIYEVVKAEMNGLEFDHRVLRALVADAGLLRRHPDVRARRAPP